MEKRIALVGIIVEDTNSVGKVNEILHDYGEHIVGRMGIPYREKSVNVISVVLDAPSQEINALSPILVTLSGIIMSVSLLHAEKA